MFLKKLVFFLVILAFPCNAQLINKNATIIVSPETTIKIFGSGIDNRSGATIMNNGGLEVSGSLKNEGAIMVGANSELSLSGDFENNGTFSATGGSVSLSGNNPQSINGTGTTTFHQLSVGSSGASLKTPIGVKSLLELKGSLAAQQGELLTLDGAFDNRNGPSEDINRFYGGLLSKKGTVDDATSVQNFGNIGVTIRNTDTGNWGEVTVTRTTGPGSSAKNPLDPTQEGINRRWLISTQFTPAGKNVNLALGWLADENNGLEFPGNQAQVWRSEDDGVSWEAVGTPQDIVADGNWRTVNVQTNSFSQWTVSDVITPLPVTWLYFAGADSKEGVQLKWATALEKNTSRFEVERSRNGKDFRQIASVSAAGFSSQKLEYGYLDKEAAAQSGTLYYRLKQVDIKGRFEYSTVVAIEHDKAKVFKLIASPNPFRSGDALTLQLPSEISAGKAMVILTNMEGAAVYEDWLVISWVGEIISIDRLPPLAPGMYMLKLHIGGNTAAVKVLKL